MAAKEIYAAFGVEYPRIPGKKFRAFDAESGGGFVVEVTADGATEPEWSAEVKRLEAGVARARKHYGLSPAESEASE